MGLLFFCLFFLHNSEYTCILVLNLTLYLNWIVGTCGFRADCTATRLQDEETAVGLTVFPKLGDSRTLLDKHCFHISNMLIKMVVCKQPWTNFRIINCFIGFVKLLGAFQDACLCFTCFTVWRECDQGIFYKERHPQTLPLPYLSQWASSALTHSGNCFCCPCAVWLLIWCSVENRYSPIWLRRAGVGFLPSLKGLGGRLVQCSPTGTVLRHVARITYWHFTAICQDCKVCLAGYTLIRLKAVKGWKVPTRFYVKDNYLS